MKKAELEDEIRRLNKSIGWYYGAYYRLKQELEAKTSKPSKTPKGPSKPRSSPPPPLDEEEERIDKLIAAVRRLKEENEQLRRQPDGPET